VFHEIVFDAIIGTFTVPQKLNFAGNSEGMEY